MRPEEIKVTRSLGAALSDSDKFGWQVSYCFGEFETRELAEIQANHLRYNPTAAEAKAMSEGRFIDDADEDYASTPHPAAHGSNHNP